MEFSHPQTIKAEDILQIQFHGKTTALKTADVTYEGHGEKSSELGAVLGFVDDQGQIHLTSNFELVHLRPKLTDFASTLPSNSLEETKLNVTIA